MDRTTGKMKLDLAFGAIEDMDIRKRLTGIYQKA